MRNIVYYVATSLDGYIAGPDQDISAFVAEGDGVEQYLSDLQDYDTVIMGRNTYEFGYQFGLEPGQPAYPHMKHYVFSNSLHIEALSEQVEVKNVDLAEIDKIQRGDGTDIYLCGGGQFAGWLLEHDKIDILKLKVNPIVLGGGTPLFGNSQKQGRFQLVESNTYEHGLQIITYKVIK